jgi:hypothetical protein
VHLTARSYLLAGFTAASIVATIPFAPRPTVHLPDIHPADVRLAAAESKIAATVRTLRTAEALAAESGVTDATATVVGDLARRSAAATINQPPADQSMPNALLPSASSAAPTATAHQPARLAFAAGPAVTIPASVLLPVAGDLVALGADLAGTQAALMNSISFLADTAIANVTGGTAVDIPPGFGVPQRVNVLTADLVGLNDALHNLGVFLQSGTGNNAAGTPGATNTGATHPGSVIAAAVAPGLSALGPLIGDVAILGVDMTASPFAMTQTVTRAIAAGATELGAGDVHAAQTAVTNIITAGLAESQNRIAADKNNIGAALARLVGRPGTTTTDQTGTADSAAARKAASTQALPSHRTNPTTVVTKIAGSSTVSPKGSSTTPGRSIEGGNTGTTKPATQSPTGTGGQSPTKAGDTTHGTSTANHSAPAKAHQDGGKHRKH